MVTETKSPNLVVYGCDIDEFIESVERSITFRVSGPSMIAMSLMSDAQEQMSAGYVEAARQTLNKAKHVIYKYTSEGRWK